VLLDVVFLVIGLVLLIGGADLLIHGSTRLASRLGVSRFVIGLTIVAFGTSAPELAGGIGMVLTGRGEMVLGTVLGSNIANIGLILGLTAIVRPVPVHMRTVRDDVLVGIGVTLLAAALCGGGQINRLEGVVLLAGIGLYIFRVYRTQGTGAIEGVLPTEPDDEGTDAPAVRARLAPAIVMAAIGIAVLAGGSRLLVDGASGLAARAGVPEFIIALTLVAVGTSLPELATSLRAAFRGESDIAVGNVLGSNIFNVLAVLGVCSVIGPLQVPPEVLTRDVWVALGAAVACIPVFMRGARISRGEGVVLLIAYAAYTAGVFTPAGS